MIFFFFIGALTAKPYAFSVRPWELERINSIDFLDSFGSEIYVEFFGLEIKRIMPKISKQINFEWITDRVRFFYDALLVQRVVHCYINIRNKYKIFTWHNVYVYFKMFGIFKYRVLNALHLSYSILYFLSTNVDLFSLSFLKNYFLNFTYFNFYTITFFDYFNLNVDYLNNYFIFSNFNVYFDDYQFIFLFGYNIRCEHPLIFFKLFELIKKKKVKLFIFGIAFFFVNSGVKMLGLTVKDFYLYFYRRFKAYANGLFLIGSSFLIRNDFYLFENFFFKFKNLVSRYVLNFRILFVFFFLVDVNLLFLGLKNDFRNVVINYKAERVSWFNDLVNFFFFENEVSFDVLLVDKQLIRLYNNSFMSPNLSLFVFLGSSFLFENQNFNLILPIPFFFEKENLLVNLFGYLYKTKFIFAPNENVRNIYKFYNLFVNLFKRFSYKEAGRFVSYVAFLVNYNVLGFFAKKLVFSFYFLKFERIGEFFDESLVLFLDFKFYVYNVNFINLINNFYFNNLYLKLSKNLALGFLQRKKYMKYNII